MSKSSFVGVAIGLLAAAMIISSIIPVSYASIESNTSANSKESGPVIPSGSSTHFPVPPDSIKASLEHINNAQEALQNGDTEGANNHLELAKESLSPYHDNNPPLPIPSE